MPLRENPDSIWLTLYKHFRWGAGGGGGGGGGGGAKWLHNDSQL